MHRALILLVVGIFFHSSQIAAKQLLENNLEFYVGQSATHIFSLDSKLNLLWNKELSNPNYPVFGFHEGFLLWFDGTYYKLVDVHNGEILHSQKLEGTAPNGFQTTNSDEVTVYFLDDDVGKETLPIFPVNFKDKYQHRAIDPKKGKEIAPGPVYMEASYLFRINNRGDVIWKKNVEEGDDYFTLPPLVLWSSGKSLMALDVEDGEEIGQKNFVKEIDSLFMGKATEKVIFMDGSSQDIKDAVAVWVREKND